MLKVGGFLELKLRALRLMSTGFFIVCELASCKNAGWIWGKKIVKLKITILNLIKKNPHLQFHL